MNRSLFALVFIVTSVVSLNYWLDLGSPATADSREQSASPSVHILLGESLRSAGDVEAKFFRLSNHESIVSSRLLRLDRLRPTRGKQAIPLFQLARVSNRYLRLKLPHRSIIWQQEFFMLPQLTPMKHCC